MGSANINHIVNSGSCGYLVPTWLISAAPVLIWKRLFRHPSGTSLRSAGHTILLIDYV